MPQPSKLTRNNAQNPCLAKILGVVWGNLA